MHNSLQSLSARMEKLERPPVPTPLVAPPSCPKPRVFPGPDSLLQAPAYSYPAITAIPNHLSIPALDLANKHILWNPITSAGVSLLPSPNPLDAFPLRNKTSSSAPPGLSTSPHPGLSTSPPQGPSSANTTCLLTAMPSPAHPSYHIRLHRGFNLVTLCLVMTASLVGSTLLSSPQWLEGKEISPGLQVIRGPFDMNAISSGPSLDEPLFLQTEGHNYPKCRPSRVLPPFEPPSVQAGVLNSPIQPLDIGNAFGTAVPDFSTKFYTTVIVKATKDHPVLPHNASLGTIKPFTPKNDKIFLKQPIILLLHLQIHGLNMRDILVRLKPLLLLQDLRHNLLVPLLQLSLGPYMLRHL